MLDMNVVLIEPEIPQNTGSIVRTCAAVGARLHLVKPLGFSTSDKYLKRAGLDYWDLADIIFHESQEAFFQIHPAESCLFISKKASQVYDKMKFENEVYVVFGKETEGLPESLLEQYPQQCYRIPMKAEVRSLNLSNAVSIVIYEAFRQNRFVNLIKKGIL